SLVELFHRRRKHRNSVVILIVRRVTWSWCPRFPRGWKLAAKIDIIDHQFTRSIGQSLDLSLVIHGAQRLVMGEVLQRLGELIDALDRMPHCIKYLTWITAVRL